MSEHTEQPGRLDLAEVRRRLDATPERGMWRSLHEVADTDEFRRFVEAEFPDQAPLLDTPIGRRRFLQLMGASLALAGATGCYGQPKETIVPYVDQPENRVPGKPQQYATALAPTGSAVGVLVESHEGRPTKIEGNPDHPASLGATDVFLEAAILGLYDPERSQTILEQGRISTWKAFSQALRLALQGPRSRGGAGLRILTGEIASPSLEAKMDSVLQALPEARWHRFDPLSRAEAREGARMAFGRPLDPVYDLSKADVILSLDADFLAPGRPGSIRYAKQFAARRRVAPGQGLMSRFYAAESSSTMTGANADHRLRLAPSLLPIFLRVVSSRLGAQLRASNVGELPPETKRFADALVEDLQAHGGRCLLIPGRGASAEVHAIAHGLNELLGNLGETVSYVPVPDHGAAGTLDELVEAMHADEVEALLVLDANPVHTAPGDLDLVGGLKRVPFTAHLGLYDDETSDLCGWHVAQTHPLETWGDLRAFDGSVTLTQPLIAPLYEGKTPGEILDVVLGEAPRAPYDSLRDFWKTRSGAEDFDRWWRRALHDGIVPDQAPELLQPTAGAELRRELLRLDRERYTTPPSPEEQESFEVVFRPDASLWDGRFANNAWLQELPDPVTKLTWDNAAWIAPAAAERLELADGDLVRLSLGERQLEVPVWIVPGQPEKVVALPLGYGRTRVGTVGEGVGVDAYRLRSSKHPWHETGLKLEPTGGRVALASTQHHHSMEGRALVHHATRDEYRRNPDFVHPHGKHPSASLYPEYEYDSYAWGMTIDLSACIGCNNCTIACQAENNIPVVGKEQVAMGREMHWIRVDRYFAGSLDEPAVFFQPVPCMHCEKAPCEVVCPVNATVHDGEGLNVMVYNRCVGTRYCSNNCPYKVRRFNFFEYHDTESPVLQLLQNPDVTVRSRGVMEKCTYCVQRISKARIEAKSAGRSIRDGEVVTACQSACPADAIVFGDTNDPEAEVSRRKAEPRNYGLLADELATQPRTTYLAALSNPHPLLRDEDEGESGGHA